MSHIKQRIGIYEDALGVCAVCGCMASLERHHLAPRAIFGDRADDWPTVNVCKPCHDEWHRVTARAGLRLWLRYLDARIASQRLAHRDAIHCLLRRPGAETRSRYVRSHVALMALERAREWALR